MSRTSKRVLFSALTSVMVLGGAEAAVRLFLERPPPRMVVVQDRNAGLVDLGDGQVQPGWQGGRHTGSFARAGTGDRVVVMGGSSVHEGMTIAVSTEQEFAGLLDGRLAQAEVLNLGAPGLESEHLLQIADEVWPLDVDVAVLYFGHNNFGNAHSAMQYEGVQGWLVRTVQPLLLQSALYHLAANRVAASRAPEFDAQAQRDQLAKLDLHLTQLAQLAQREQVTLIVVPPVSNLFWPPSVPCSGPDCAKNDFRRAMDRYRRNPVQGLAALRRVRDADPYQQRAPTSAQEVFRAAATRHGLRLVDAEALLPGESGLPADKSAPAQHLFVDSLHFTAEGHQAMAELLEPEVRAALSYRAASTTMNAASSSSSVE